LTAEGLIRRLEHRVKTELWIRPQQNFAPLDGLRGFASCIVVFYHCVLFTGFLDAHSPQAKNAAWLVLVANGFWSGIDIFFVLSGFLIGRLLIRDLQRDGRLYYRGFFTRRGFRIFPAYYLVLTASMLVILPLDIPIFRFLYLSSDWKTVVEASWSNYLYLVNYVRPGNTPSPMSWAWSLCVEEHFYALLPVLLFPLYWFRWRALRPVVLSLLVIAPLASRTLQYLADPSLRLMDGFYYYSHNRFDEIFVGVLIAYFYVTRLETLRSFASRLGKWLWIVGFACTAIVWTFGGLQKAGAFAVAGQFSLMAIGTGLILVNCLFLPNAVTRFFAHRLWYPLARISYGTYLVHPFVLFGFLALHLRSASLAELQPSSVIVLYALVMLTSSLIAGMMFIVVEAPLLRAGMRISARSRARSGAWDARSSRREQHADS
jgi:peptidoglycan/LPS O-acetylase OafA/YrhL